MQRTNFPLGINKSVYLFIYLSVAAPTAHRSWSQCACTAEGDARARNHDAILIRKNMTEFFLLCVLNFSPRWNHCARE